MSKTRLHSDAGVHDAGVGLERQQAVVAKVLQRRVNVRHPERTRERVDPVDALQLSAGAVLEPVAGVRDGEVPRAGGFHGGASLAPRAQSTVSHPLRATRVMVDDDLRDPDFAERRRLQRGGASRGVPRRRARYVDEIVVVDQMSTDGTPEIAERLADVFIRDVRHGHAEPSRELAASRSSGDWILILDADERMSDLLKAELPDLRRARAPTGTGSTSRTWWTASR